jgi:hypothetical protein
MKPPEIEFLLSETRAAYAAVSEAGRIKPTPGTSKWDYWQELIAQANELNTALLHELETQATGEVAHLLSTWW